MEIIHRDPFGNASGHNEAKQKADFLCDFFFSAPFFHSASRFTSCSTCCSLDREKEEEE